MHRSKSKEKAQHNDDNHNVIDLATSIAQAQASDIKYVCKECSNILQSFPQIKQFNPHAGHSFICSSCNKIYDSSLEKLPKAVKKVRSNIASEAEAIPFIETIDENTGIVREDDYALHDPEGDTDERMKLEGWHIVESKIELTDSKGQNRTVFKRINR